MASMMEMYQIAKDMSEQQAQNNMGASGSFSLMQGYERGLAKKKQEEANQIAMGLRLLEMQKTFDDMQIDKTTKGKLLRTLTDPNTNSPLGKLIQNTASIIESAPDQSIPQTPAGYRPKALRQTGNRFDAQFEPVESDIDIEGKRTEIERNKALTEYYKRKPATTAPTSRNTTDKRVENLNKDYDNWMTRRKEILKSGSTYDTTSEIETIDQKLNEISNEIATLTDTTPVEYTSEIEPPSFMDQAVTTLSAGQIKPKQKIVTKMKLGKTGKAQSKIDPNDQQAYEWAQNNPDDPRSKQIILKLKSKGY